MLMITAFCFIVEVFISKMGIKISCRRTSISFYIPGLLLKKKLREARLRTLSFVRNPEITLQKISTLNSNTWGTGLTALRLKHKQRYWFIA